MLKMTQNLSNKKHSQQIEMKIRGALATHNVTTSTKVKHKHTTKKDNVKIYTTVKTFVVSTNSSEWEFGQQKK